MLLRGNNEKETKLCNRGGSRGRVQGVHPPPLHKRTCGFLNSIWRAKKRIDAHKTLSFHVQTATFI